MMRKLFYLQWEVPKNGFQWINRAWDRTKKEELPGTYLADIGYDNSPYYPLEEYSGLFYEFAEIAPNEDAILLFANKYGNLEKSTLANYPEGESTGYAISIDRWIDEISSMKQVVDLWALSKLNNHDLSPYIEWMDNENIFFKNIYHPKFQKISNFLVTNSMKSDGVNRNNEIHISTESTTSVFAHSDSFPSFCNGELQQPADYFINYVINVKIRTTVSPRFSYDIQNRNRDLYFELHSLINALWLQFAQAVGGKKDFTICKTCNSWFELAPNVKNKGKGKIYCTDACKSKAWRLKKRGKK